MDVVIVLCFCNQKSISFFAVKLKSFSILRFCDQSLSSFLPILFHLCGSYEFPTFTQLGFIHRWKHNAGSSPELRLLVFSCRKMVLKNNPQYIKGPWVFTS